MAGKATIYKVNVQVADMDRHYYADHALTVACHPSETPERMMVRVLAFALHAHPDLTFGRGLSTQDEPDLWQKDLTGAIDRWIAVGQPEERDVRRACGRARQVVVVGYGGRSVDLWWNQNRDQFERQTNLTVIALPVASTRSLGQLASRTMQLQCNIQERLVSVVAAGELVEFEPAVFLTAE